MCDERCAVGIATKGRRTISKHDEIPNMEISETTSGDGDKKQSLVEQPKNHAEMVGCFFFLLFCAHRSF